MLPVIRFAVGVAAIAVLPISFSVIGFHALALLGFDRSEAVLLSTSCFLGLTTRAVCETSLYRRELRSVAPRPVAAANAFVGGLALVFLATSVAWFGGHVAGGRVGLGNWTLLLSGAMSLMVYAVTSWVVLTPKEEFIRGRTYRSFREVHYVSKLENLLARGERISFGGISLPWSAAVKHWLVLGVTGAGKSMLFQVLMQCTLRGHIGRGRDERGLIYDNKTEVVPLLAALGIPYKILHPFDRRGAALDVQSMVPTHTHALELASVLMPKAANVGSDPFWIDAPRNLLASVMTSFRLGIPRAGEGPARSPWDFRDLVLAMQSQERIREIIVRHEETRSDIEGYFDDPRLLANVMATIKTSMMYYRPIAACWSRARERINLTDAVWGEDEYLLVLGNDEEFRQAINSLNRAVVTRYGQLALKRPKSSTRRVWFYLDEFPDLKRIDPDLMAGLLTKGRSKGISVLLGVQTLLSVIHEYGREVGKVILSQCQNIAILGLGDLDDETAEYAARVVGQCERQEQRESETPQGLFTRRTTSEQPASRSVVLSSEFADLPETVKANGLPGYYRTRSIRGFWGAVLPGASLDRELARPDEGVAAIEERGDEEHTLRPWDDDDLRRLGLESAREISGQAEEPRTPAKPFRIYRGGKPRRATGP